MPELMGIEGWCPVHLEENCKRIHLWSSQDKDLEKRLKEKTQALLKESLMADLAAINPQEYE